MEDETEPQENGDNYRFHRSDVPALLFAMSPIVGLALDAPPLWWIAVPAFWAGVAVAMGYVVRRGR